MHLLADPYELSVFDIQRVYTPLPRIGRGRGVCLFSAAEVCTTGSAPSPQPDL
jgi:hypothetical protein